MQNKLIYVIGVVLLAFALFSGSKLIYYIVILYALMLIISYVILRHNAKNLFVLFYAGDAVIESGDCINVEYKVSNTSFIPITHAIITFNLTEKLSTGTSLHELAYLKNYEMLNYSKAIVCPYRGYYRIGKATVTLMDPLGIHKVTRHFDKEMHLTVYPKLYPLDQMTIDAKGILGTLKSHEKTLEDRTNIINIRDYVKGDQLKAVHWKLSAKNDRLMMREFEKTLTSRMIILMDGEMALFDQGMTYDEEEAMVSFVASLIRSSLNQNQESLVYINDSENTQLETKDVNGFKGSLEVLTGFTANGHRPINSLLNEVIQKHGKDHAYCMVIPFIDIDMYTHLTTLKASGFDVWVVTMRQPDIDVSDLKWTCFNRGGQNED